MEGQLKFGTILPLKEMALRRVAAHLWSFPDVLAAISRLNILEFDTEESFRRWRETIEDQVKDKMSRLELPESLKKQLIEMGRAFGVEVNRWKDFQEGYLSDEEKISLPDSVKLFWTTAGMIDYRKTAEELVRCDALDIVHRYQLSCLNCLEDDIPFIWEKLPEESKRSFLGAGEPSLKLTQCWPYIIGGKPRELDYLLRTSDRNWTSFNQWAFERSAKTGNKTAAKYFFNKLTSEEREASLMRTVKSILQNGIITEPKLRFENETLSDTVCYLITLLPPEQQMEVIGMHPEGTVSCFLYCPSQELYLENAGLIWTFIPESLYSYVLDEIYAKLKNSRFHFPKLFQEFCNQSAADFRTFLVDHQDGQFLAHNLLRLFLEAEDPESIEVMLRGMDALDRAKLVSHRPNVLLFCLTICRERWLLVEVCLREATLSSEDKRRVRDAFERHVESTANEERDKLKYKRCFEFLEETHDESIARKKKAQKRKLENYSPER